MVACLSIDAVNVPSHLNVILSATVVNSELTLWLFYCLCLLMLWLHGCDILSLLCCFCYYNTSVFYSRAVLKSFLIHFIAIFSFKISSFVMLFVLVIGAVFRNLCSVHIERGVL